jgi:type II secretory pathway component PulJ
MKSFKVSTVLAIVLASVVLLLVTVRRYEAQLQTDKAALRQYTSQLAELQAQNSRLSKQIGSAANWKLRSEKDLVELMRLRSEVGQLRKQMKEGGGAEAKLSGVQPQAAPASTVGTNGIPKDAWAFAGYQTPANALESVLWAMKNGNVNSFVSSLTPEAQEAMAEAFDGMTDAEIADQLESEIDGLDTLPLDRVNNVSETETSFVLFSDGNDNGTVKTEGQAVATFVNINGEWRFTGVF